MNEEREDMRVEQEEGSLPLGMDRLPPERRAMGFDGRPLGADDFSLGPPRPPGEGRPQNPFEDERFSAVPMPDTPIHGGFNMAEMLVNDDEVPKPLKKKYWNVFHKDNVLTFLDENRKASKLLNFDIMKIDILNSTPYYEYDFKKELEFTVLRNAFETKLDRAMGFKGGNQKNERIVLQSQFTESRSVVEQPQQQMGQQNGFFKRLLGRR